jgi:hypothetical protein
MISGIAVAQDKRAWRESYKAALFELDVNKVPDRIVEAEKALVARARQLFDTAGDNIEEEQDLDDAMYALRALRSALKHRPKSASINEATVILRSA